MINLSTGAFYERSTRQIGSLRAQAETLQQQIGTGERLERSSDDPVAAARLRMLARTERITSVDTRNSELAEADLALTDQTLSSIADIVMRVRELAVQATVSTLNDDQRAAIGVEVASLRARPMSTMAAAMACNSWAPPPARRSKSATGNRWSPD